MEDCWEVPLANSISFVYWFPLFLSLSFVFHTVSLEVFFPASMPFNWCISHEFSPLDALPLASLAFSRQSTSLFLFFSPDVILSCFFFHSLCSHDMKRKYIFLLFFSLVSEKHFFFIFLLNLAYSFICIHICSPTHTIHSCLDYCQFFVEI